MSIDEERLHAIVQKVLGELKPAVPAAPNPGASKAAGAESWKPILPGASRRYVEKATATRATAPLPASDDAGGDLGVFAGLDDAVKAAAQAQQDLMRLGRDKRVELLTAMRQCAVESAEEWAQIELAETGYGRVADKVLKVKNAARLTPGVEDLETKAVGGDNGVTLIERSPFGVVLSLMPSTHPMPFVVNHAIAIVAAGNSIVVSPHPRAVKCTLLALQQMNQAVVEAGGPRNLLTAVRESTMETVQEALKHPLVSLVTAAGGPGIEKLALSCGKKAIVAGPGNPPVVVDETADPEKAARDIIAGATFDNNILCIAEKSVFAVDAVYDRLLAALERHGGYRLRGANADAVTRLAVKDGRINAEYIGKDAAVILRAIGVHVPDRDVRALIIETDASHPLVQLEQMMPVLPVVRVKDFATAVRLAKETEHGFKHSAMIHSRDVGRITAYAREIGCELVIANAPSYASLDIEGESHFGHTIAMTGEGICTPSAFTRERRLTIGGALSFGG